MQINQAPSILTVLFRMAKKLAVSGLVVFAYIAFVIQQHFFKPPEAAEAGAAVAAVPSQAAVLPPPAATAVPGLAPTAQPANTQPARPTVAPAATNTVPPTATSVSNGQYQDGEYTGDVANAYWGEVQVKVIIQNGSVSDVQFLDYPHDRRTSVRINNVAVPYLRTEAIRAQTARVNIISGATLTSEAFIQSLGSALRAAH